MLNEEIVLNKEFEKLANCADSITAIIEVLRFLNNACFDMTCHNCDLDSNDKTLRTNAEELVKDRPKLYAIHYVIGEELEKLDKFADIVNTEAYQFYFGKELNGLDKQNFVCYTNKSSNDFEIKILALVPEYTFKKLNNTNCPTIELCL